MFGILCGIYIKFIAKNDMLKTILNKIMSGSTIGAIGAIIIYNLYMGDSGIINGKVNLKN